MSSSRSGSGARVRPAVGRRPPAQQLLAAAAHLRAAVGCAATRGDMSTVPGGGGDTETSDGGETIIETTDVIASVR